MLTLTRKKILDISIRKKEQGLKAATKNLLIPIVHM